MSRRRGLALALLAGALLAGCGDSGDGDGPKPPLERRAETADELPKLPAGWSEHVNRAAGVAFGLPPGWRPSDRGTVSVVRSFDRLVSVSIAADRTDEALALPLGDFAARTVAALEGYEKQLEPGEPHPFKHRYEAVEVRAEGTAKGSGVKQEVSVVYLRRRGVAGVTAIVAASADPAARASRELADELIGTIRTRPVGG